MERELRALAVAQGWSASFLLTLVCNALDSYPEAEQAVRLYAQSVADGEPDLDWTTDD